MNEKSMFIVYTPFQLINSINILKMYNLKNVDCVLVHKNMERYIQFAKHFYDGDVQFFEEYCDATIKSKSFFKYFTLFFRVIKKKIIAKKTQILKKRYDNLFVPSDDINCQVFYNKLKKSNLELKLLLYDDGVGTYTSQIFDKKTFLSRIVFKCSFGVDFYSKLDSIYCYHPELINKPAESAIVILPIEQHITEKEIKTFFNSFSEKYANAKVIFFDQGYSFSEIFKCLNILKRYYKKEEIIIKKHPRIDGDVDYSDFIISKDGIPAEFLFLTHDFSNTLLISYSSTSCLSPYLICNTTPKVIMLNMIKKKRKDKRDDIVNALFQLINKKIGFNYIKTPSTIDEFISLVDNSK